MTKKITRRKVLTTGAAGTAMLFGSTAARQVHAWAPGPNENLVRDLTPGPTPIRISENFTRRENESVTEAIKRIRENGNTSMYLNRNFWSPVKDSEVGEFKAALKKYGVLVFEFGGYSDIIHPDVAQRQKNIKNVVSCMEIAEELGSPMVGTITGCCDPRYGYNVHPDNWTEKTWELTVDSIKQILHDSAGMKVLLGVEAQVTTNLDGPKAHKRLLEDVGDPRCVVNLDPTNMVSLSNYYHTTELINECFDLLGENIHGCHAKDPYIWPDKQTVHVQEVCPGRGVMDYETYLVRMSRLKWPRTIQPEHLPEDQYPEARAYIRKVAAKVGVKIHE